MPITDDLMLLNKDNKSLNPLGIKRVNKTLIVYKLVIDEELRFKNSEIQGQYEIK